MPRRLIVASILAIILAWPMPGLAGPKTVVFIRYPIAVAHFTTVIAGFKATMARRGFVEGEHITYIDILTSSDDASAIPEIMAAVETWQDKADMIITCGWVSMYARPQLLKSKTPQLFVPVLDSVARTMLPSLTDPPQTNLSGIYLMYPPEKILRLTRLLIPRLRHYAYVFDSRIPADLVFKTAYEQLTDLARHGITIHYLDLAEGVEPVLAALQSQNIEAFGGIVGSFRHRRALAASGLPVISAFSLDIEENALAEAVQDGNMVAGLYNPFRYSGEQAAEITADIFSHNTALEHCPPRPSMQIAFINLRAADRLGIRVPFAALEAVDRVIR
jgi:putative ABC transport system substrate-binding protein